jgi:hypothetical protein
MSSGLEGRFGIPNASNDKMTRYDDDDKQFEGSSKYLSGQAGREHASLNPAHDGRHHRHLSSSLSLIAAEVNSDANISLEFSRWRGTP